MKGRRQLKDIWKDPNMKELIDTLWREYPGLYNEKYDRDPEKWLLNAFSPDIDFGQALGMDHTISGNISTALGMGHITTSFLETVLGSYSKTVTEIGKADPELWVTTDKLFTIGNGTDKDNRSDALVIFKSGLTKIFNAIQISKYEHGLELPLDGMIQYLPQKLELYFEDAWHELALKSDIVPQVQSDWTEKKMALPQFIKNKPENIGTKVLHDFVVGDCIKLSGNIWVKSVANNKDNAGTVGLVSEIIDTGSFLYLTAGLLRGDYIVGEEYFLSTGFPGQLMILADPEIWQVGQIREFIGTGTPEGLQIEIDLGDEITEGIVKDGNDGISAYQVAVNDGFVGTEPQWIASLQGKDGLPGYGANFMEYTAFVSQTGTANPTTIELENRIGAIVVTRIAVGTYNFTLAAAFVADKTTPIDDIMMDQLGNLFTLNRISADVMQLKTYAAANVSVLADGILSKRYINFIIFP